MEINLENYTKLKEQRLKRAEIAETFGIPEWKLKKLIANNGWGKKAPTLSNKRAFSEVTRESAYWIGFLAADGCVDEKGRVRVGLQRSDVSHLYKLAKFVGSTHKVQERDNRCDLEFSCAEMVADLSKYGIVPRKSIEFHPGPVKLYSEFLPEFFRGWFDGDGTICESFSNKASKLATLYTGIACSKPAYPWIVENIFVPLDISHKIHERDNHMTVTLNTNKSIKLLNWMYSTSTTDTRLDRKYDLYIKTVVNNDRETREL